MSRRMLGGGGSPPDITASSTSTFTNKTIDANGTGNVITNIGDAELESHTSTKIVGLPTQTSALDMGAQDITDIGVINLGADIELTIATGSVACTETGSLIMSNSFMALFIM